MSQREKRGEERREDRESRFAKRTFHKSIKGNLILCGLKGSGKTTLGRTLAHRLDKSFVDTDELLVKGYQQAFDNPNRSILTCRDLYKMLGTQPFRSYEQSVIVNLQVDNTVVAIGGGSLANPVIGTHLVQLGRIVYLQASEDTLWKRLLKTGYPPFLPKKNGRAAWSKRYHWLDRLYQRYADCRIAVPEEETVVDLLERILEEIKEGKKGKRE